MAFVYFDHRSKLNSEAPYSRMSRVSTLEVLIQKEPDSEKEV